MLFCVNLASMSLENPIRCWRSYSWSPNFSKSWSTSWYYSKRLRKKGVDPNFSSPESQLFFSLQWRERIVALCYPWVALCRTDICLSSYWMWKGHSALVMHALSTEHPWLVIFHSRMLAYRERKYQNDIISKSNLLVWWEDPCWFCHKLAGSSYCPSPMTDRAGLNPNLVLRICEL